MNENRPPDEDGPPNNQAPKIVSQDGNAEQLELPFPPDDDGLALGPWMETLPRKGQYRSRRLAA